MADEIDREDLELELEQLRAFKKEHYPTLRDEIQMWRCKFLDETLPDKYKKLEEQVRIYFLKTSSSHIKEKGVNGVLKDIEKIFLLGFNEDR